MLACPCQCRISLEEGVLVGEGRSHHVVLAEGGEVVVEQVGLHHEAPHGGHAGWLLGGVRRGVGAGLELVDGGRRARLGRSGRQQVVHVDVDGARSVGPRGAQLAGALAGGGRAGRRLRGARHRLQEADWCRL